MSGDRFGTQVVAAHKGLCPDILADSVGPGIALGLGSTISSPDLKEIARDS